MPAPSDQPTRIRQKQKAFVNWHRTLKQPLRARFDLFNPETSPSLIGFRSTARALQELIRDAQQKPVRLRALGAGWSFSEVAAVDGWQLNTAYLNWVFRLDAHSVVPEWADRTAGLVLAQCGVSIHELNRYLEHDKHRSLRTSGASNGQTIAGAISTDTHGSAIDCGPLGSQVLGIHLITAPDQQLWIERASQPVLNPAFVDRLGASLVRDDALFNAALVGLGSLGIVHAVLLDTTERFLLRARQVRLPYDAALKHAMNTHDFSALGYALRPYFFQVVVNPHAKSPEAYVKVMYREPCPESYQPNYAQGDKRVAGYDLARLVGRLLDAFPGLTRSVTRKLVKQELKESQSEEWGSWGEIFDFTTPRAKSAGASLGVPRERCTEALELVRSAFDAVGGAPMVFACRFVQRSSALLALARFAPTCVIDLDGVHAKSTLAVMEGARRRLEAAQIPFTQHWGKLHGLTPARVRASYGPDLTEWLRARRQLLPTPAARFTFSNELLERLELSE